MKDLRPVRTSDGILIKVKVQPKASRTEITVTGDGTLKVRLTEPPERGRANAQLKEVLAEYFGVKKSAVIILKGEKTQQKTIQIKGVFYCDGDNRGG